MKTTRVSDVLPDMQLTAPNGEAYTLPHDMWFGNAQVKNGFLYTVRSATYVTYVHRSRVSVCTYIRVFLHAQVKSVCAHRHSTR